MTVLLRLEDGHKAYGDNVLLDGAAVALDDATRVGLVGRNGAGKSTLVRILVGEEDLDGGLIERNRELRLGYLRQHDAWHPEETVAEFLQRDSGLEGWRCGQVAGRLELKGERLEAPITELSGGWRTRVKLAALLLHEPNFLILDEPTNFLDLRTQLLLERFLAGWHGGCLLVSHDRDFLRATCDHTLALAAGELELFPGDDDAWLEAVAERREHARRVNASVAAKRKQLQRFVDTYRAKARRASQARNKAKQIERLETVEIAGEERRARIRVPAVERRRGPALTCTNLTIGYPGVAVATDIDLEFEHGTRAAVVGDNGEGKTTFLRTVAGSLPPRDGELRWGFGCDIGLYAQHVYADLTASGGVRDYLLDRAGPEIKEQEVRGVAGGFLFSGDDWEKPVTVLSGGERARLVLAGLLLGIHNVLVLDEPSNHLDVESVDALAEALRGYAGTVLLASHDRTFVRRVASAVVEVGGGAVRHYPAPYDAYCHRVAREIEEGERPDAHSRPATQARAGTATQEKDGKRAYRLRKRTAAAERKVGKLEGRQHELENAMSAAATDHERLLTLEAERRKLITELERAEEHWLELQAKLEEMGS